MSTTGKPHRWQKGEKSPNPSGRPPEGQAWKAIIREISEMSPAQICAMVGTDTDLGKAYQQMPQTVKMKYLVVIRAVAALMFEPNGSLLEKLIEREDGKVPEKMDLRADLKLEGFEEMLKKVYGSSNG